jgi:hypothetical protein
VIPVYVRLCGRRLQYVNVTSCFWITEPASFGERTKISPKRKNVLKANRKTALSNVFVKLSIHLYIPSIIFSKICFVIGRRVSCDFRRLLHPVRSFFLTTKALEKSLTLVIRLYKNIKNNQPVTITMEANHNNSQLCPVTAVHSHLQNHSRVDGPLFQNIGGTPVTHSRKCGYISELHLSSIFLVVLYMVPKNLR